MATTAPRRCFIGGNWKCAATKADAEAITARLNEMGTFPENTDVFVSPSTIHLSSVKSTLRDDVLLGAQNVFHKGGMGAYTGESTPTLLLDSGVHWTLVGHSERRNIMGESVERCGEKAAVALAAGLSVVFCIGEKLEEREADNVAAVLTSQLAPLVAAVPDGKWDKVVIAYEPVWAIGTGVVATPDLAQAAHALIRGWLADTASPDVAASVRIIYGGSVKGANCKDLIVLPDVDGFLVGGASLKPEFVDIISCTTAKL